MGGLSLHSTDAHIAHAMIEGIMIQADLLGADINVARMAESSALGAAFAAGLAVGFWQNPNEIRNMVSALGYDTFKPKMGAAQRQEAHQRWQVAVRKSFGS